MFEKTSKKTACGASETLPRRSWNLPKSSPGPSWAACGSQESPKSAQETPKKSSRGTQERPKGIQERPRAAQEAFGRCPNPSKIGFGTLQDRIFERSWPKSVLKGLQGRFLLVFCVARGVAILLQCVFRTIPASVL